MHSLTPVLSVRNLTTELQMGGRPYAVVKELSFDLFLGKCVALVGESGCGKSMTALSLMRILPHPPALPSRGELLYRGRNLLRLSEREMRSIRGGKIAMIFQDPAMALNPVYTIGQQVQEAVELHLGVYGEEAENHALQALSEVGIPSVRERFGDYPHQMSGGMKQRVMIAMALVGQPDILIADEPTTALDVTIQMQVLELIRQLQRKKGMALLLITHDMGVVAEMADDVVIMYAAQDMERGSVYDIFDRKAHPYTRGLFQSRVGFAQPGEPLQPIKGNVPSLTHYPQGCRFHPRCPFVMPKCRHGNIPNFLLSSNADGLLQHEARCLLYDQEEESRKVLALWQ